MAIGDKPNQNLFGTDYNAEDEEEKKARLAAQGAMMGAGDQSFRGATGIQDIAGMQGVPQGGTLDPAQGARDLLIGRQFNRGGPVRISDMGSLIQAPQGVPALDSNIVAQVPGIQNIRNPGAFDPANMEPARPIMSAGTAGRDERTTLSEYVSQGISSGVEGLRDAVGTESVSMEDYRAAQAAQAASNLEATPSVTPPAERPMAGAQEQPGAVVSPFLQSPDTPSGLGGPLLRGFEMVNDAAQGPNAPMGQDATRAALGGMTLNEYLNAPAGTEGVSGLRTDPQGRMIPAGFETRAEAFPDFERESAAREARLDARPDFGEAVSDRDRRAARGDDISMADQTDMAKANARGASPTEVARGNQVANALGVDLETGQPLQATGGLTFEQQLAQNKFEFDVNKFNFEQAMNASDEATANAQSATAAKFAVRDQLRQGANVMDKAQRAGKNIGFSTTGATGALLGLVPGTGAYDQKATVETLEADAAFSALQRMRDASKTGGALGNVSERELDLLKATAGSLRVGQSEEQFRENLGQYVERYNEAMLNVYDAFVADYGEEDANEAFKVNGRQDLIPNKVTINLLVGAQLPKLLVVDTP